MAQMQNARPGLKKQTKLYILERICLTGWLRIFSLASANVARYGISLGGGTLVKFVFRNCLLGMNAAMLSYAVAAILVFSNVEELEIPQTSMLSKTVVHHFLKDNGREECNFINHWALWAMKGGTPRSEKCITAWGSDEERKWQEMAVQYKNIDLFISPDEPGCSQHKLKWSQGDKKN